MTSGVSYTVKDSSGLGLISRQTSVIHKKGIIKVPKGNIIRWDLFLTLMVLATHLNLICGEPGVLPGQDFQ